MRRLTSVGCCAATVLLSPLATVQGAALAAQFQPAAADVTPEAVDALRKMSAYLTSLNTMEVTSEGSLDVVTEQGQRVQMDGVTKYKVRKPGFVIDYESDLKSRRFIYDGKTLTVVSPKLGYYASVPAPATNREVLELAYETYGIKLPLEDLFRWNDPGNDRVAALKSGYKLGTATLGGVPTDHYVFREDAIDWEVWIQQGEPRVPRKLVIVDRTDAAHPTFTARLNWTVNPPLTDADFAFQPGDAKRIDLATFEGSGE